ncbi:MAG: hypothetical protein CSYNP_03826 [Syntrophus sp. SKADARSKE-3]|nr:hypothetical protein [Syntrophus sp. SKADARSKE-3]
MKTIKIITIAIVLILVTAGVAVLSTYNSKQKDSEIVGSVTLGIAKTEADAGVYIADELGLFTANGINVILRPLGTGLAAYNAMIKGEVDVSFPTEFIVVGGAYRHHKIHILSTVVKGDFFAIIGRKDHGIGKSSDLAGKRIGLKRNTIEEFFLGRILDLEGKSINDVTLVDMPFPAVVGAMREGAVDAVVTLPPYSDSIRSSLGGNAVEWSAQSGQWLFEVLTATDAWIAKNSDLAIRLLRALNQADMYIYHNPQEAKLIVRKRLNLDAASVDRIWSRNYFSLSLDQSLIHAMEDEARWMIRNNMTTEKTVPDFTKYIYSDGLKSVKPEAVNIIH